MALVQLGERLGDSPGEVSELVEKAMRSPGVTELMAVYDRWQAYDDSLRTFQQIAGMMRVVSLSDSSGPVIREI